MDKQLNICLMNDSFPPLIDGVANTVLMHASFRRSMQTVPLQRRNTQALSTTILSPSCAIQASTPSNMSATGQAIHSICRR